MQYIQQSLPYITVSLTLYVMFMFGLGICFEAKRDTALSSWAGVIAGFVVLVTYIVWPPITSPADHINIPIQSISPGWLLWGLFGVGCLFGVCFLWLSIWLSNAGYKGLLTLGLTSSSTISTYVFYFQHGFQRDILFFSLGLALGVLIHLILWPSSISKIF